VNQKILFVDDEPTVLDGYRRLLGREFDIATASGGQDALTILRKDGPFAVVVADLKMAGMDGVQFLKHVRHITPNTIRLMLTGHPDLNCAVDAINESAIFRFLTKPCDKEVLINAISTALAQYRERKEERIRIKLPVCLYRPSDEGKGLSAHTVDISKSGVRVAGISELLVPDELIEIECANRKALFRVVWVGAAGTPLQGHAGLACLAPSENIWALDFGHLADAEQLARARVVQSRLLPQEKPLLKTLDYTGNCTQARTVGGDYYDFLETSPGEVGFVLADIAGKGIAAALLMANLHGILHAQTAWHTEHLPELLAAVNRQFFQHTAKDRYATFFFGRYSDATRSLRYVNCGHNPPILLRKSGAVERLQATATVLGLFSEWQCTVAETALLPGDILTIFTDGITETTSQDGSEFGETGILEVLQQEQDLDADAVLRKIEKTAERFRFGEQTDDLTLVIACAR